MKYNKLGKTGIVVSEICLGSLTFGDQVDEANSIRIIKSAVDSGVNFIDTADSYVDGKTEEIVGKAIKEARNSIILATKIGRQSGPGFNDIGLSRKHILLGVEASLRRLQTDYIDIYYMHIPDYNTPIEETLRALDDLIRSGKVLYIACSNYRAWQLCEALWVSDLNKLARFECIQTPYNLLTRNVEYELLPLCSTKQIGVTVYSPLAGGILTGKHNPDKSTVKGTRFATKHLAEGYTNRYWLVNNFEAVNNLKKITEEEGQSLSQFSLAWILNNNAITSVVIGVTSLKQLQENMGATQLKLTAGQISACDKIWQQLAPTRYLYGQ